MAVLDYAISESIAPASEPVTQAEAKKHLEIASAVTDHDDFIDDLIVAARRVVENDAGRALVFRTLLQKMDRFPAGDYLEFKVGPATALTSVQYLDIAGDVQTFTGTTLDTFRFPGGLILSYGESWPSTQDIKNAVTITYVAGRRIGRGLCRRPESRPHMKWRAPYSIQTPAGYQTPETVRLPFCRVHVRKLCFIRFWLRRFERVRLDQPCRLPVRSELGDRRDASAATISTALPVPVSNAALSTTGKDAVSLSTAGLNLTVAVIIRIPCNPIPCNADGHLGP